MEKIMDENRKTARFFIIIGVLILITFSIHAYNITHKGDGQYYINLYPDTGVKNYKIIADIETTDDSGDYYILKAHFPNRGYISFDNQYGVTSLEFNKKVELTDDSGRSWFVELTDEKVNQPGVVGNLALKYVLVILGFALFFIQWTLYLLLGDENGDDNSFNKSGERFVNFLERFPDWFITTGYWGARVIGVILLVFVYYV
jgi:hypothetical protein